MKTVRFLRLLLPFALLQCVAAQTDSTFSTPADSSVRLPVAFGEPWSSQHFSRAQISSLPYRSPEEFLPLVSGIATVNGLFYTRGSRSYDMGYRLNGLDVVQPFSNSNAAPLIPEAMEELVVHTGAFGAELGTWNGGVVEMRMREGGDDLAASFRALSDDFAKPGTEFLHTSSYGFKSLVGTFGGPLTPEVRFFLAGEVYAMRDRRPTFIEPFRFDTLVTDNLGTGRVGGTPLPGSVVFDRNHIPGYSTQRTTLQGNLVAVEGDLAMKLLGSYSSLSEPVAGGSGGSPLFESDGSGWSSILQNYFSLRRMPIKAMEQRWLALQSSYALNADLRIGAAVSYTNQKNKTYDPDFGDDWRNYADSVSNYPLYGIDPTDGSPTWHNRYSGPYNYSTIYNFSFIHPYAPNNSFSKSSVEGWTISGHAELKLRPDWSLHAGAQYSTWVYRSFAVGSIFGYRSYLDPNRDGIDETTFADAEERRIRLSSAGNIQSIGYDVDGNEVSSGPDAPKRPAFTDLFLNNQYTAENVRWTLGVRYEVFDLKFPVAAYDTSNGRSTPILEPRFGRVDESQFTATAPRSEVLPRLSVEYHGASSTFSFSAGKYVDMAPLSRLYFPSYQMNGRINPSSRVPYWLGGSLAGHRAEPERSTLLEARATQHFSRRLSVTASAYYKSLTHQLQLGNVYDQRSGVYISSYVTLVNEGEGIAKGVELNATARPVPGVVCLLGYSVASGGGISSHPTANWRNFTDQPVGDFNSIFPFDYDIRHRATGVLTVQSGEHDFFLLDRWEISGILLYETGHPYTRETPPRNFGSATAWNVAVRYLADVRSQLPLAEYNDGVTPSVWNLDIRLQKPFVLAGVSTILFVDVKNALNTRNTTNVYPATGSPVADGWLSSEFAPYYLTIPRYADFYNAINRDNHWAYTQATGNDMYSSPRQIRLGLEIGIADPSVK